MKILVENAYIDGHCSTQVHVIPDEELPPYNRDNLDALWDHLWTYTGDGYGESLDACYEVTILDAPDPFVVGESTEWC